MEYSPGWSRLICMTITAAEPGGETAMKADERKALHTNVLADHLNKAYEGLKQGPSRKTVFYGALLLLAVLVVLTIRYFMLDSDRVASERWTRLDQATFLEQIDDLAEDKDLKGTTQGRLARYLQARANLALGLRDLGNTNREAALERIKSATETYEDLLKSSSERVPLLRQEALWGAATGNETLGDIEKARGFYEKLARDHSESELGKEAQRQLDRLDDDSTQRDLKRLRQLTEAAGKSRS
jgi:hypothetical protein